MTNCTGVFASFLSGREHAPAALCLHRQLRRSGAQCPFRLVYDDAQPHASLGEQWTDTLSTSLDEDGQSLVRLTSLFDALGERDSRRAYYGAHCSVCSADEAFYGRGYSLRTNRTKHGRRLLVAGRTSFSNIMVPFLKVWLWALPYPRVLMLDLDVLPIVNMDTLLLRWPLPDGLDVAGVRTHCKTGGFNSGVLFFKPSKRDLSNLQRKLVRQVETRLNGRSVFKVCEIRPGDQSLLNMYYGKRTAYLPKKYNVDARDRRFTALVEDEAACGAAWRAHTLHGTTNGTSRAELCFLRANLSAAIAVLHFAGMGVDKPWQWAVKSAWPKRVMPRSSAMTRVPNVAKTPWMSTLYELWLERCGARTLPLRLDGSGPHAYVNGS